MNHTRSDREIPFSNGLLNPAVCRHIIPFIHDNYVDGKNIQFIICSHSPEILGSTFSRSDCYLFQLVSGQTLNRIGQSQEQLQDALRKLGTSEIEELLYKGTIFVEGEHDAEIIERGFGPLIKQYKLKDLGGRSEIEKQIKILQSSESTDNNPPRRYFIFDHDRKSTDLKNSDTVKITQLQRYCLENYLIDLPILEKILTDSSICKRNAATPGPVHDRTRQLAMSQLESVVVRDVYNEMDFENLGLRSAEINGLNFFDAGTRLFSRLQVVHRQVSGAVAVDWVTEFQQRCEAKKREVEPIWLGRWQELCDGKRLIIDLHTEFQPKMSHIAFKTKIIEQMALHRSVNWAALESMLRELIS